MESCGQQCLKWLMFGFNLLFFICGGVLLGLGIWVLVDGASFMSIVATNQIIFNAVYIIIAVGAALVVISFLGCCGAIKENKCLLGAFFGIVLVIFIVEIVGGILAFIYYPDVQDAVKESISSYGGTEPGDEVITSGWDTLQALFQCCGFNSSNNWVDLSEGFPNVNRSQVPPSCCTRNIVSLSGQIVNETACGSRQPGFFYNDGCETKIRNYYWSIGGAGIGILFVELLAMIFACCLYRAVGKDEYA